MKKQVCAIVGVGPKNGEAFARRFHEAGYDVALLARSGDFVGRLASELEGKAYACDVADPAAIARTFANVRDELGDPDVLVYNAGSGSWKGFDETTADDLDRAFRVNAVGLVLSAQEVVPAMRRAKRGSIVVVGATASLRGKPKTTSFAAAKAAQRSLAQSMARQLWPEGIHVALLIVDGGIGDAGAVLGEKVTRLDPVAIAESAFELTRQAASAWSFEIDLRPKDEPW
jgi:short-subunit dehydrogenase